MDRVDYSPFPEGANWGTSRATQPYLVAEIRRLRECYCGSPAGSTGGTLLNFQSAAVMRASTEYRSGRFGILFYIDSSGGGGGGLFVFNADSIVADDNADTFKPDALSDAQAGRWERVPFI